MYEFAARIISKKRLRMLIILSLSFLAAISVVQGAKNAVRFSQDFQWDAARAILERLDPYEISLDSTKGEESTGLSEFYRLFTDKGLKQKMEANQFPSLLMMLLPYACMSPIVARYAWLLSNLAFTLGIVWLLRKTFLKDLDLFSYAVLMLLMIAGTPYRNQLGVGQHTLFSFFFFLLAVWLDEKNPEGNGVLITLCMFISYFKYTLTAPLTLYLLYRKRFKEFVISVVLHCVLTVMSAIWLGKNIIYMITAPLKVASVLSSEGGLDLGALMGGGAISVLCGGIVAIALIVIAAMLPKNKEYILYTILVLWSLILTYHRTYDYFVLSSIGIILTGQLDNDFNKGVAEKISIFYWILLILIYFGLRIFNENVMSRIVIGAFYYTFTCIVSILAIMLIKKGKGNGNLHLKNIKIK